MKELMKPRVIVTNWYPKCPFNEGSIGVLDEEGYYWFWREEYESYGGLSKHDVEKATANFAHLQWYEKRELSDMPEYLVNTTSGKVYNVEYSVTEGWFWIREKGTDYEWEMLASLEWLTPATLSDYTNYLNSKQSEKK